LRQRASLAVEWHGSARALLQRARIAGARALLSGAAHRGRRAHAALTFPRTNARGRHGAHGIAIPYARDTSPGSGPPRIENDTRAGPPLRVENVVPPKKPYYFSRFKSHEI